VEARSNGFFISGLDVEAYLSAREAEKRVTRRRKVE
jgi:hypothetical protein